MIYRFDAFALDSAERRLTSGGLEIPLTARTFDLLLALVERAGELVSKDELMSTVWAGFVVEESNLPTQISVLRKVLGAAVIVTVPRHGYRFARQVSLEAPAPQRTLGLPVQLTSFIGREAEIEETAALIKSARLLTFTGSGGCGKTRLALALAQRVATEDPEDVHYLELASLADASLLESAAASAFGVKELADASPLESIVSRLGAMRALLVVDNCEHLIGEVATLCHRILNACSDIRIIATSREPLRIPGEISYRTPSLPYPQEASDLADQIRYSAVRLFVERARAVAPDFALGASNVAQIVSICSQLDGIPLAIELAASRVATMPIEEISRRLDSRCAKRARQSPVVGESRDVAGASRPVGSRDVS